MAAPLCSETVPQAAGTTPWTEEDLLACVIGTHSARKYEGKLQAEPAEEVTEKKTPQNVWG